MTHTPERVACYLRVSTAMQAEKNGTDAQRQSIMRWLADRGIDAEKVHWLEDSGISGAKGAKDRPGYAKLIGMLEAGELDVIVAFDLSRIFRDVLLACEMLPRLIDRKVTLALTQDRMEFDPSSPFTECWVLMSTMYAQMARKINAERVRAGIQAKIARGEKWGQARVPWEERSGPLNRRQRLDLLKRIRNALNKDGHLPDGWAAATAKELGCTVYFIRSCARRVRKEGAEDDSRTV